MSAAQKQLEALEATIAKATAEVQVLRAQIEEEAEAAKRPDLAIGQVWKHEGGAVYLAVFSGVEGVPADLVCIKSVGVDPIGAHYNQGSGMSYMSRMFTYLGIASDLLTIKEPTK